jgi:hypothetical protein
LWGAGQQWKEDYEGQMSLERTLIEDGLMPMACKSNRARKAKQRVVQTILSLISSCSDRHPLFMGRLPHLAIYLPWESRYLNFERNLIQKS